MVRILVIDEFVGSYELHSRYLEEQEGGKSVQYGDAVSLEFRLCTWSTLILEQHRRSSETDGV